MLASCLYHGFVYVFCFTCLNTPQTRAISAYIFHLQVPGPGAYKPYEEVDPIQKTVFP